MPTQVLQPPIGATRGYNDNFDSTGSNEDVHKSREKLSPL